MIPAQSQTIPDLALATRCCSRINVSAYDQIGVETAHRATPTVSVADSTTKLCFADEREQRFDGAIAVFDADVTISYSYDAHVSTSIVGGATPTKQFYITGDMEDRVSGENGELRIPQVNLSVDGDVDWLSAEPIQAVMAGVAVVAAGEEAPYTFVSYKASA